jgi:hypothetical protein
VKPTGLNQIWSEAARLTPKTLGRAWPWLTIGLIIEELTSYGTEKLVKMNDRFMLSGLLLALAVAMLISVAGIIIINQIARETETGKSGGILTSLKINFKYVFIESTRALLPITLKILLFIVPGIVEAIRLYFIPFIVQFEPTYAEGKIDALERSRELVRGHFWQVTGILLLSTVLSILPRLWLGQWGLFASPVFYFIGFVAAIILGLYSYLVLYCVYWRLANSVKELDGNSISLQGSLKP